MITYPTNFLTCIPPSPPTRKNTINVTEAVRTFGLKWTIAKDSKCRKIKGDCLICRKNDGFMVN